jgi:pilus assembly protein FimV
MDKPLQENDMAIDDSSDREDIALSTSELDDVLSSADLHDESGDAGEPDLEKYGIWIKVEPQTLESAPEPEEALELSDLEAETAGGREAKLTAEEEELLGELESESSAETGGIEAAADMDLGLEELAPEPGEESLGELPEAEIEVPLSEKMPALDAMDVQGPAASKPHTEDIFRKIEQDLKQIKSEIQNLKRELAGIGRGGAAPGGAKGPSAPAAAPGFFAEEEDDSIALTGDELDNILNTADITEEQAGGQQPGLEEELALPETEGSAAPAELEPVEEAELIEPGSLSAAPDLTELPGGEPELELPEEAEAELEALEEPGPGEAPVQDLEPVAEEAGALEPEALEAGPEELLMEDLGVAPAEELGAEEPAGPADELTLDEFSVPEEPVAEPLAEVEPEGKPAEAAFAAELAPEAEPAEELELVEELGSPPPVEELAPEAPGPEPVAVKVAAESGLPQSLREDVRSVLSYLDQLLEALPEDKIRQFAQSEYFGVYKRLFEELGLGA